MYAVSSSILNFNFGAQRYLEALDRQLNILSKESTLFAFQLDETQLRNSTHAARLRRLQMAAGNMDEYVPGEGS